MSEDLICHGVCVSTCTGICKCAYEGCMYACVLGQLEICCWTTALDLLTNYLNSVQAGASACVSHSFNEFFSCSPPQPRSLALQIHMLLQISVFDCICLEKLLIEEG